jgi:8-oxo-dGTP diphosphatase
MPIYPAPVTPPQLPPMARPRVAAGALFTDAEDRILLVRPTYKPHWDIPGGYVEPGESPRNACAREVREELGLSVAIGRNLVTDWAPADGEGDKLLFIFDAGFLDSNSLAELVFLDGEVAEVRFVSRVDLEDYTPPRLSRRLNVAITARVEGRTIYAEHGLEAG